MGGNLVITGIKLNPLGTIKVIIVATHQLESVWGFEMLKNVH